MWSNDRETRKRWRVTALIVGLLALALAIVLGTWDARRAAADREARAVTEPVLTRDLGLTMETLRAAEPAGFEGRIAARVEDGALTPCRVQGVRERSDAYNACRPAPAGAGAAAPRPVAR